MIKLKHWQDAVNAVIGVWLILSPWAVGLQVEQVAMANAIGAGVVLVAVAVGAIFVPRAWEEWTEGIIGIWLIASPWVLGFGNLRPAMLNAVAAGILIALLALWTLAADEEYGAWWRNPTPH